MLFRSKDYPDAFARLRARAMACDFSWGRSAGEYLRIYSNVTGQPWPAAQAAAEEKETSNTAVIVRPEAAIATVQEKEKRLVKVPDPQQAPLKETAAPKEVEEDAAKPQKKTTRKTTAGKSGTRASTGKKASAGKKAAEKRTTAVRTAKKSSAKQETNPKNGTAAEPDPKEEAAE